MRPPLELHAEVESADGRTHRWGSDGRAENRPQGLKFTTARFDGFKAADCTLPRRIDRDHPDLRLRDGLTLVGYDGSVAWEGRMVAQPRSFSDGGHSISIQAAGWLIHAQDTPMPEIVFVDRDVSRWQAPPVPRRASYLGLGKIDTRIQAETVRGGLIFTFPDQALTTADQGELHYQTAEEGLKVKKLQYAIARTGDFTSLTGARFYGSDDEDFDPSDPYTLNPDGALHEQTLTTARRYVLLQAACSAGVTPPAGTSERYETIAVYGDHGLTLHGTETGEPDGVIASDVIRWIAERYCPKLSTAGVQSTHMAIPHLVIPEGTTPYDAFKMVNARHLWGIEAWENRTLHYGPVDLRKADWQVSLNEPGVTIDLQGPSAEDLVNGICVSFTTPLGEKRFITPATHSELLDGNTENEATRHAEQAWEVLELSFRATEDDAVTYGTLKLAELNSPSYPGTIVARGHVRDSAGNWQQGWKVRAGQTIAITDHPNDRPRLIQETSWDQETKTLTVATDAPVGRLEAVFEGINGALAAKGFS